MTLLHQAAQKAVEALKLTISARTAPNEWDLGVFETAIEKCEVVLRQVESALQQQPEPEAYMDEKGEFHRLPRFHFLGLVDESCGSRDHIWSGTSLAEAGEAWKRFVAQGSKDVDLTGWGCGIIADHRLMSRQFTAAAGAFACPICGQDTPHQHSPEAVDFHRDNEKWAQEQHAKAWQKAEARVGALEARYPPRTPLYASPALQHQEEPREPELLALIERYAAEREEIAVEAHSFPGDSWKNKQPAADETLAKIKCALAASPPTTRQQETGCPLVTIPASLWAKIEAVLAARQFIDDGESQDNDSEVIEVLAEIKELNEAPIDLNEANLEKMAKGLQGKGIRHG